MPPFTREALAALDATDALARFRDEFALPDGVIYLDGNSLGPLPRATAPRLAAVIADEWGRGLIRSWNDAGWMTLAGRVAADIEVIIGASPGTVAVGDSTSVNVFKALGAALASRPDRRTILSQPGNFPTDLYVAEGLIRHLGRGHRLRLATDPAGEMDEDTAAVLLTHVDYRSGRMLDMSALTRAAHEAGALIVWDLAHSAGAVPLDIAGSGADFAVGCGYKYLCGGPGAPGFLYIAPSRQPTARLPLTGWLGHAAPFAFEPSFRPATGIAAATVGTPPILSLAALAEGTALVRRAPMDAVRHKSAALADAFIFLVEVGSGRYGVTLATPRAADDRGSQVSFHHPEAERVTQALIGRGVIGDMRAPDILRFGLTPLSLRFVDVWDAAETLRSILADGTWQDARYATGRAVT